MIPAIATLLETPFATIPALVHAVAQAEPGRVALIQDDRVLDYRALDAMIDRVAAGLQRDGIGEGKVVAVCASSSVEYAAIFLGTLRAGAAVAPLAPSSTGASLRAMLDNAEARLFFLDASVHAALGEQPMPAGLARIAIDGSAAGRPFADWLAPDGSRPAAVQILPDWPFNLIYSSGTTGEPKGIVQSHGMRWRHVVRAAEGNYDENAVTLISTPLYSNTTLVSFLPTLALGGTVVLMAKFDAARYLELAERHRATHTMLVPVQYQRLMAHPDFDRHDLSAFRMKFVTSSPFQPRLKAEVLARWPGGLTEYYGMTEGGGTCELRAHEHPDKLHTVGRPALGSDIRLIGDDGREVGPGETGEVVGHSAAMMTGYHRLPAKTAEAEWYDASGKRFIRTGDVGRFDEDGFLVLMDRKKDMIISGGFNIYPSDLEAELLHHPDVAEAAVVGVRSEQWGETPVGFVVLREGASAQAAELLAWVNARVGKTQRLADLRVVEALPRSAIGKVLKRELRDAYAPAATA